MSPSKNKPLKKGPLKNISPGAYFRNFTVPRLVTPTACAGARASPRR